MTASESKLPDTCTLLLSLDLNTQATFDPRTYMATEITENTSHLEITERVNTHTTEKDVVLGKGGMGIVKCGQQRYPDREVAIKKVLRPSNTHQRMLLHEAQITGQLEHPSIVPIHQIKQDDDGNVEIIMKRVQGKTLLEMLDSVHTTPHYTLPVMNVQYLIQTCFALEYAHNQNIVHRDIKLENIMVGDFNEVFLMDWGLGMDIVTKKGAHPGIVGTPCYMAPEMLSGNPDDIDFRTDVYLMGATIHHWLTGQPLHNGANVRDTLELVLASKPHDYPSEIPTIFGRMLNKACHQAKSERFQTIKELREALEAALEHWEAIQLTERAKTMLDEFESLLGTSTDSTEITKQYLKIRALLESSIEMWKENTTAVEALHSLLILMVDHHIDRLELSVAESLFAELTTPPASLQNKLLTAQSEYKKLSNAHALAQEYDPLQSKSGRKTLIVSIAATSVLLVSFAGAYSMFVSPEVTTLRLMYTGSLVSISCIVGVFLGRKTLLSNKLGAQMARTFTTTSVLATFNHWIGHINGEDPAAIMSVDMFIMAVAFASMKESIRSAYYIATVGMTFATIGALYPRVCHPLLLLTIVISSMWALLDWYKEDL